MCANANHILPSARFDGDQRIVAEVIIVLSDFNKRLAAVWAKVQSQRRVQQTWDTQTLGNGFDRNRSRCLEREFIKIDVGTVRPKKELAVNDIRNARE